MRKRRKRKAGYRFALPALLSVLACSAGFFAVDVTMAYLQKQAALENQFKVGTVSAKVEEAFGGEVKQNVRVINDGTVDAYVRVKLSFSKEDAEGRLIPGTPEEDTDYDVIWSNSQNWLKIGDFYYYKKAVKPGDSTDNLMDFCYSNAADYHLIVDVSSQSIQATKEAVEEAWKAVDVTESGEITAAGGSA